MDVLVVTDFPDVRLKSLIQSADEGTILLIPREGGYLVRTYVEMDKLAANERVSSKNITVDHLIAAAKRILHPYSFDVKEVAWWSVYEIGQRVCDKFDDVPENQIDKRLPHVFIAGDACHTHSPKAGQGMNVSMQDSFNLGWKLAAVLQGRSSASLLHSYSAERQAIAKQLIDFDRKWATMLSAPLKSATNINGVDPSEVQKYFVQSGRYTAGTATRYTPSLLTGEATYQDLAEGFPIGMRFHSAPVFRLGDAKKIELGHTANADGRWRIYAFAGEGDCGQQGCQTAALCEFLLSQASPVTKFTPKGADVDSIIDVRAIFQQAYRDLSIGEMPSLLLPAKGRYGLRDYEKIFCADHQAGHDVFDLRGIKRKTGCMIVVRPDQYVAHILPLDSYPELSTFFEDFMVAAPASNNLVRSAA